MNTEIASEKGVGINYEYLQVRGTVVNFTNQPMIITSSDLSWGKWIQSPVDVPAGGIKPFASQGRDSSPSGTEGTATWKIGNATITIQFACPLRGSNYQSISCIPADAFDVTAEGTGGNVNSCVFQVKPRKT